MSNGHQPSEEIMNCIVQEQQRHLVEQYQNAQRQRALAMARTAPVLDLRRQQTAVPVTSFGERAYAVRAGLKARVCV